MKLENIIKNIGIRVLVCAISFVAIDIIIGCSDNVQPGLYADNASRISLSVSATGFNNGMIQIGSAQSSTVFTVTATTRWTVEVSDCEGAWCDIKYGEGQSDKAGRIGDGTFSIEAAPNRGSNNRTCTVTVYAIESDGTHLPGRSVQIYVDQERQSVLVEYDGEVIPSAGTTPASQPTVTVRANQAWNVSSSHSWVQIIPSEDMTGDGYVPESGSNVEKTVSFKINVDRNRSTATRNAELTISSPTSAFTPVRISVIQQATSTIAGDTPGYGDNNPPSNN